MPLQTWEQILSKTNVVLFGEERYYCLLDLLAELEGIGTEQIKPCDVILTPYYVEQGARLELYWAELELMPPVSFVGDALAHYCTQHLLSKEVQEEVNAVARRESFASFDAEKLYVSCWNVEEKRFE